jgi:hypothetical protein
MQYIHVILSSNYSLILNFDESIQKITTSVQWNECELFSSSAKSETSTYNNFVVVTPTLIFLKFVSVSNKYNCSISRDIYTDKFSFLSFEFSIPDSVKALKMYILDSQRNKTFLHIKNKMVLP